MKPIPQIQPGQIYNTQQSKAEKVVKSNPNAPDDIFIPGGTNKGMGKSLLRTITKKANFQVPTAQKPLTKKQVSDIMKLVKPGDIILKKNENFPVTWGLQKIACDTDYTHVMIYEGDGNMLHSANSTNGVVRENLEEYLDGSRFSIAVVRPEYKTEADRKSALDYCRSQLGKPYDSFFNEENSDKLYCSELVRNALEKMPNPIKVPTTGFFGKQFIAPDIFNKTEGFKPMYSTNKATAFRSFLKHYMVGVPATLATVAGGIAMGPLGATAGFAGVGLAATLIGNKIQHGKFSLRPSMDAGY
ncbi:MAG: YiiX/YebB-like N1pC/P60 family cysteine hydrolase [Vulcanimicrobiota bacterium]